MPSERIFSGDSFVILEPKKSTSPLPLLETPAIDRSVDDFPAPFAPNNTTVSPFATCRSTFFTATTWP